MQLAVWTYEGPPHVGAMRVATAMTDVHFVMHAPQGDTYADLLFTMIERRNKRPPVTYTTFEARDLGSDTAEIFKDSVRDAYERFKPGALLIGESCTAELLQDNPSGLAKGLNLPVPTVGVDLPAYQRKEHWGASETFYQLVRHLARRDLQKLSADTGRPSCNLLGPTALGFRHRDDVKELAKLMEDFGIDVNIVAPLNCSAAELATVGQADFNIVLYPEVAETAARWLEREFGQPFTKTVPLGITGTRALVREVSDIVGRELSEDDIACNMPWWSRSIDSTYLTDKRVFVFGEGYRAAAAAKVASSELGFQVVGLGCYNREGARAVRETAKELGIEPLITDDYLAVEEALSEVQPELVLGTQMERHIAKRLGLPCTVISSPVHVQDFPAGYSPQYGPEGANQLFDTWVHPLVMGLEEHLLGMFREDFEFNDDAGASHLGGHGARPQQAAASEIVANPQPTNHETATVSGEPESADFTWEADAEKELKKIPFFVRGKARRNTERYAVQHNVAQITVETLYEAKAHYGR
ncbi:MAG: ferredoxin:protochlorophyllide reductase (ATP-dependent) subunit B [Parvularculaceae bacterium]|nr:ferredoxin:protochlorophyllide reductase (ATP-dependent) subunit B [Parvularculaceae bacterium]